MLRFIKKVFSLWVSLFPKGVFVRVVMFQCSLFLFVVVCLLNCVRSCFWGSPFLNCVVTLLAVVQFIIVFCGVALDC